MKNPVLKSAAAAMAALLASSYVMQAHARPPTVQNSPGYERALKQSRANYLRAATEPAAPAPAKKKPKAKSKN